MKFFLAVLVVVVITLLQAQGVSAVPVALKFSAFDGYYAGDDYGFSGIISYDSNSFQNAAYDVSLRTREDDGYWDKITYYEGHSSYVQPAPSLSIFRLQDYSSNWFNFDMEDFNSGTDFINTINIETDSEWPASWITFTSRSDKYFLTLTNIHGGYAGFLYAQNRNIYDIPTATTPFWRSFEDDSMYYFQFDHGDIRDAGFTSELTPVPEPGTGILVSAALLGLLPFARRRRG